MSTADANETKGRFVENDVRIDCYGLTDIGMRRESNQDQFLIADLHKQLHIQSSSVSNVKTPIRSGIFGKLMLVADGMGGASAGDVASEMAVTSTAHFLLNSMHWLFHPKEPEIEQFVADLKAAARFSHEVVLDEAESAFDRRGMGTTLTVAYLLWPTLYVLHVGDSRCYVLHDGRLKLLTKDQTLAQRLYDEGQLSDVEYTESPFQHVLMSAIGIEGEFEAAVYRQRMAVGDKIMLCSDGANAHLNDDEIGEFLAAGTSSKEICETIVSRANQRGGRDNTTVVVASCLPTS